MSQNHRKSKVPKPDCKVWVQVGEETLVEYLNKPIEIEGVEGYECYVQVALGETLTVHCQGNVNFVDQFVLIADGVIRACSPSKKKHGVVIIDEVLHRARGKGKQLVAVYRSDMVVQMRAEKETRFAEGDKELSKVGSIIIEGWKGATDPAPDEDSKGGEILQFATYDKSHEWYDVNRFVNSNPGHMPPFELGYVHAKNSQPSNSKFRARIGAASTRKTSEWKLAYRFVFNYRSTTELHKLGLPDVPVRNPPSDLFAEDPTEGPAEEEATDDKDQAVEPESENDSEAPDEVAEEIQKEKKSTKAKGKKVEEVKEKSAEKPKEKTSEELEESSPEDGSPDTETTKKKKKSKPEKPAAPKQTVSGLLSMMASAAAEASASAITEVVTVPEAHSEEDTPADLERTAEVAGEPVVVSQQKETEESSRINGEVTASKAEDNDKASQMAKTTRKASLQGLKSAPANRAARDQPSPGSGDMLDDVESTQGMSNNDGEDMLVSVEPDQVLPTTETPAEPLMSEECKDESSKPVEVSNPAYQPMTPPPTTRKSKSSMDILRAPQHTGRRASLPSKSSLKNGRERPHSEPRSYVTSPDYTISHVRRGRAARVSFDERLRSIDTSMNNIAERPASQASVVSEPPQDRAQSEVSDAPTDVADPGEVQMSVKQSQRLSSSTSVKSSVELAPTRNSSQTSTRSGSMTSEVGNHTLPSPILGRSATPFLVNKQLEGKSEVPAIQARLHLQEQETPHDSPSIQIRQEIADSFNGAPLSLAPGGQIVQEERPLTPAATPKVDGDSFVAYPYPSGHSFFSTQSSSLLGKRKADEATGNGSTAESARPRKFSVAPAARSLGDTLRHQQEENERLEKELKDLRHYNATLENIRELRKHSRGVKERIDAEKARQAALEAELGQ